MTHLGKKLRVAVVIPDIRLPRWIATALFDIVNGDYAQIAVVIHADDRPAEQLVSALERYVTRDEERHAREPNALELVDATPVLSGVPTIHLTTLNSRSKSAQFVELRPNGALEEYDVILKFTAESGELGERSWARCGVWTFRFGSGGAGTSTLNDAYFDEVFRSEKAAALSLVEVAVDGTARVVNRSRLVVNDRSLWATRNPILWRGRALLRQSLKRLHQIGALSFRREVEARFHKLASPVPSVSRSGLTMPIFQLKLAFRRLLVPYFLVRDQWRIALRQRGRGDPPWGSTAWCRDFRFLEAPRDRFWADPFLFKRGEKTWLFFEDYCWQTERARISCCKIGASGAPGPVEIVLDRPYHLSNPLIFDWGGDVYLIPETMAQRRVEIYRCLDFPTRWELVGTVLEERDIADPCVVHHADKWWLFAVVAEFGCPGWEDLHVFWADDLLGPWHAHPLNPVVSDVGAARPGGRISVKDGKLYRLAQDSSGGYGSALHLCEIEELSEIDYRQRIVASLDPFRFNMNGVHAYDASDAFEVVDGRHYQAVRGKSRFYWSPPRWFGRN